MNLAFDAGWIVARFTGSVLMGARVVGQEHVPLTGGLVLASNHISYFDPPLVGCYLKRRGHFFAKKELFDMPVLGLYVKSANSHPVRRGGFDRNAIETAISVLQQGNMLTLFPEGTRGRNGKLLEPKAGVGKIARAALVPIVPCFIHNAEKFTECLTRKRRLLISYGEPLSADWIGALPDTKESWIQIAQEVMRRIKELKCQAVGDETDADKDCSNADAKECSAELKSSGGNESNEDQTRAM
ncbi:1-acyl-sn-glycerol-3-phosphate acyltransferase [Gemmatimonas aurantiaca]|nr:1-acyl-sn-glycerol-3-phosphate acyltransferase [Gemmatimonas aurantiaca]